jgi:hypothetical protein
MGGDISQTRGVISAIKHRPQTKIIPTTGGHRSGGIGCWLLVIGSIPANIGFYRRCRLLPLFLLFLAVIGVIADVGAPLLSRDAT